jgi:hypothetical protein
VLGHDLRNPLAGSEAGGPFAATPKADSAREPGAVLDFFLHGAETFQAPTLIWDIEARIIPNSEAGHNPGFERNYRVTFPSAVSTCRPNA